MTDPTPPEPDDRPAQRRWTRLGLRGVLIGAGEPAPPARSTPNKAQTKQLTGRLAGLSLPRQVWVLSLWPLLEQLLNFLVGTVDIAIAGRLEGDAVKLAAMDAIAIGAYFTWLMTLLQAAVGVGAAAIVSRAIGASHRRMANAGVGQALLLGVASGVIAGAIVLVAAPAIATLMGLDGQAHGMAVSYIRITALGIPMCGALFVGGACLRAAGDTRSPFLAMLLVNILNVAVSVGLAGISFTRGGEMVMQEGKPINVGGEIVNVGLGWGVTGIAAGTAIAWTFGGFVILAFLLSGRSEIRLRPQRLIPRRAMMRRILRIATPNLFSQLGYWGVNFALLFYVSRLPGKGIFGAHMIAIRVESVAFLPGFAISVAASTLTGQYLGLGDPERARRATYWALGAAVSLMSFCSLFFFFTPEPLVALLSPDTPEHLALAPKLLRIAAPFMPLFAVCIILGSSMRGAGDTRATTIIEYAGLLTTRLIGAYLLAFTFGLGLRGIWLAMMADLAVRGVLFFGYYRTGRWARTRV